uniref:Uncharacterized protein n=1 Tax=Alexandrium monilatum TaxID=311494 RepID=A0A6T0XTJ1_9DINO|mmetsp:Transcript_46803/g.139725  ORF Transcript_46803/g.139725 Transcript_46803/m.139725 type:complete len:249 (+) Transcript_46803:63-809(+)
MLFRPPARSPPGAETDEDAPLPGHRACELRPPRWAPGSLVERLLDDVSDIWAGATVLAAREGDLYDVQYADDQAVEHDVEGCELRKRTVELNMPADVWVRTGSCLSDKLDLCAVDCLARSPHTAAQRAQQAWWCVAFHQRFGRCSFQCEFSPMATAAYASAAAQQKATAKCLTSTGASRLWKERYMARERNNAPCSVEETDSVNNYAYATSGKAVSYSDMDGRLRYGRNNVADMYFDPRLGCLVADGQ